MTTKSSSVTTRPARALRAPVRVGVPTVVLGAVFAAAPALADTPANWPEPTDGGSFMDHFMIVAVYPIGLAIVIALLAAAPALLGKDKKAAAAAAEGEWLGGPAGAKAGAQESSDSSGAGGASGKW